MLRHVLLFLLLTLVALAMYCSLTLSADDMLTAASMAAGISLCIVVLSSVISRLVLRTQRPLLFGVIAALVSLGVLYGVTALLSTFFEMLYGLSPIYGLINLILWLIIAIALFAVFLSVEFVFALHERQRIRLHVLTQQMQPHFLFNSLTTLSSYIDSDTAEARRFVTELADMYRGVLRHISRDRITLASELRLVRAYAYILQRRYGDGLRITLPADDEVVDATLPPFALQTLIENAVRHNAHSAHAPLHVSVTLAEGTLTVRNNLLPLSSRQPSTGVGLANLAEQYRLLSCAAPRVVRTNDTFTVTLTLLPPL